MAKAQDHPHHNHRERMRKRIRENGLNTLLDHELLEYLLYFTHARGDTNPIAHELLRHFGSLDGVFNATYEDLLKVDGVGPRTAELLELMLPLWRRYSMLQMGPRPKLNNCQRSVEYAKSLFIGADREYLYLLCLDVQCNLIQPVQLAKGTIDEATVYSRSVLEAVLRHRAKSVVLVHNHLSPNYLPSRADILLTQKVITALSSIEVDLLDHLIISQNGYYSFLQDGRMEAKREYGQVAYAADREL
ncbi:MAG: DNA repair protein RadC [Clostridiales bacterium]|nr:DNA repair protein RadC [Clostridiales bacterium]